MKTAIELLEQKLDSILYGDEASVFRGEIFEAVELLKGIEREQIIGAAYYFLEDASRLCGNTDAARKEAEEYFNRVYQK